MKYIRLTVLGVANDNNNFSSPYTFEEEMSFVFWNEKREKRNNDMLNKPGFQSFVTQSSHFFSKSLYVILLLNLLLCRTLEIRLSQKKLSARYSFESLIKA